jgi:hypothetical protein
VTSTLADAYAILEPMKNDRLYDHARRAVLTDSGDPVKRARVILTNWQDMRLSRAVA